MSAELNIGAIKGEVKLDYDGKGLKKLEDDMLKAEGLYRDVNGRLRHANGKFAKETEFGFQRTTQKTKEQAKGLKALSGDMVAMGSRAEATGKRLTKNFTAPAAVGLGAMVKSAISFESAFAGVKKTVEASEEEFAQMEKGIRDMSKQMPVSANELSGLAEAAGQLGIENKNILGFTKTMAELGVATNLTSEEAAMSLAKFANATNMPQKDFDRLGSVIVRLGNNIATTEADIVRMGSRMAGAAAIADMSQADIMSWAAALSSVGIEAEAGGSSFQKVVLTMDSAVKGGGDELKKFADIAGVSAQEFARIYEQDANKALLMFIGGIGRLKKEGKDVAGALKGVHLNEIRTTQMLIKASTAQGRVNEALKMGRKEWEENTALQDEVEKKWATTESRLKIFMNTIVDVGISLGQALTPAIKTATDVLQPMVDVFSDLPGPVKTIIVSLLALAAATGPTVWAFGALAKSVGLLIGGIGKLGAFLRSAPLMFNPWVLAIVGAIAVGYLIIKNWDTIKESLGKTWNWLKGAAKKTWGEIKNIIGKVADFVSSAARKGFLGPIPFIIAHWKDIVGFFKGLPGTIKNALKDIGHFIAKPFVWAWNKVKQVIDKIKGAASDIGDFVDKVPGGSVLKGAGRFLTGFAEGGRVGPNSGGPRLFVAGEGGKDEWVLSQEGDRKKNIGYALEFLEAMGVPMFKKGKGGKKKPTKSQQAMKKLGKRRDAAQGAYGVMSDRYAATGGTTTPAEYLKLIKQLQKEAAILRQMIGHTKGAKHAELRRELRGIETRIIELRNQRREALRQAAEDRKARREERQAKKIDNATKTPLDPIIEQLEMEEDLAEIGQGDKNSVLARLKDALTQKLGILQGRLAKGGSAEFVSALRQGIMDVASQLSSLSTGASTGPSITEQVSAFNQAKSDLFSQFANNISVAGAGGTTVHMNMNFQDGPRDPHGYAYDLRDHLRDTL